MRRRVDRSGKSGLPSMALLGKPISIPVKLLALEFVISVCTSCSASKLTLDDFGFLEKGMTYKQVVQILGRPNDQIEYSPAFITYIYELEDKNLVYLGFLQQADFLDTAYYYQQIDDGLRFTPIIPKSLSLPSGIQRDLSFSDFDGLIAGIQYFPDVYN